MIAKLPILVGTQGGKEVPIDERKLDRHQKLLLAIHAKINELVDGVNEITVIGVPSKEPADDADYEIIP